MRVLLALDETDESVHAAQVARDLFGEATNFVAVNVADEPPEWASGPVIWGGVYPFPWVEPAPPVVSATSDEDARAAGQRTAGEVAAEAGVPAQPTAEVGGDPVEAILDAADAEGADVIVVGSSQKGWWQRLFDPSVSKGVVESANRPVLVVPSTTTTPAVTPTD